MFPIRQALCQNRVLNNLAALLIHKLGDTMEGLQEVSMRN